jgi:hypothetical protein
LGCNTGKTQPTQSMLFLVVRSLLHSSHYAERKRGRRQHHGRAVLPFKAVKKWTRGIGSEELEWTGSGVVKEDKRGQDLVRKSEPRVRPGKPSRLLKSNRDTKLKQAKIRIIGLESRHNYRPDSQIGNMCIAMALPIPGCVPFRGAASRHAGTHDASPRSWIVCRTRVSFRAAPGRSAGMGWRTSVEMAGRFPR